MMLGMAITHLASVAAAIKPMAILDFRLWPESDDEHPPRPGDLLVIVPWRQQSVVGPSGWTAEQGAWWKVLDASDGPFVKITAPYGTEWGADVLMLPAGSYSLQPSDAGSAVPWEGPGT
jgi:hypothetical protein